MTCFFIFFFIGKSRKMVKEGDHGLQIKDDMLTGPTVDNFDLYNKQESKEYEVLFHLTQVIENYLQYKHCVT